MVNIMSEKELKDYMKKQSMKTLKGLKEIYENEILELELNDENADGQKAILEAAKFEIMVRDLKKLKRRLNSNKALRELLK